MEKILFEGMYGLGDNIYQRPFLRHFPGAYLRTPWPEIYSDMDIHCVRSGTNLRTQKKNELRTASSFTVPPIDIFRVRIGYGPYDLEHGGVIKTFRRQFGITSPLNFDFPVFNTPHELIPHGRKIAVIRPATIRTEWSSASRNPDPLYLYQASQILRKSGFYVICIADIEPEKEWIIEPTPVADLYLIHGELSVVQMFTLYQKAHCVVSPVGFSLPLSIATKTPLFIVAGGLGGHNSPEILTSQDMRLDDVTWALPDNYCQCTQRNHQCSKTITNFNDKFYGWLYGSVCKKIR